MKRVTGTVVLLCALFFLSFGAQADTIRIKADEWCPFNCLPDSDSKGYMIEVAERIFQKAGHQLKYEVMPWSRSIEHARKGKIEGIVGATKGEVPDFIFPEEEFGISLDSFYVKRGNPWRFKGVESLDGMKVGIQNDYEYGERIDKYFAAHMDSGRIQAAPGDEPVRLNIRKLVKGRVDAVIEDKLVFLYNAKEAGLLDQVEEAGSNPIINPSDYQAVQVYIAFSPKNPKSGEYARILSEGIREMRASGEFQKILDKYGLKDWKGQLQKIGKALGL